MSTARASTIANAPRFCESRQGMKKLEDDLTSAEALAAPLYEIERMMRAQGRELMRSMMQAHVDARTAQERPVTVHGADGIERVQTRQGARTVMTEFGEVVLERTLDQAPGVDALAPVDAALGLAEEKYSHEVRRIVAEESARAAFDEVVELVKKHTGAKVPKRQLEELAVRAARDFDAFYRERPCTPEVTDDLLILSFDGKGIAMRLEDLRAATRPGRARRTSGCGRASSTPRSA